MQTLVTIHSWTRWLVLVALVAGSVLALLRYRAKGDWSPYVHQMMVMVIDIQVAVGLALWVFYDGWRRGFFFSVYHPVVMLAALGVAHIGFAIAGRRAEVRSWLYVGGASIVSLALIIAAIPWDRL